jgi:hypothetical protein
MRYLHDGGFKAIAMRDLATYVDRQIKPKDPWQIVQRRRDALLRQP